MLADRRLLTYQSAVTRNYAEKSINNILDYVGGEEKVRLHNYVHAYNSTRLDRPMFRSRPWRSSMRSHELLARKQRMR